MASNIDLSVCMIVKNEEKVLERILLQAKQFADEIVVVDTGSNDKTKEIASKHADKVLDFAWQEDFSQARNFSFDNAEGNYLMWLDADDFISSENIQGIKSLKENGFDADVYMLKYQVSFDEFGVANFEYYRERIVKNSPLFRWQGFLHEAIVPSGQIKYLNLAIQHRKVENTRDTGRNLRIYEKHKQLGEVFDPRSQFYYARELYFNNRIDDAIVEFKKFIISKKGFVQNRIDAHLTISKCYVLKNNLEEAKNFLIDSLKIDIPNAEICCALGEIYNKQNNIDASIFWYNSATLKKPDLKKGGFVQKDFYDFIPLLQLSCLYYRLGNQDKFEECHNLAKALKPNHASVIFNQRFVRQI